MKEEAQESSQIDMIKSTLQQIIDEMNDMESQRILPEGHSAKRVEISADIKPEVETPEENVIEGGQEELDPAVLKELISKAGESDSEGNLPEDQESEFDPEIAKLIAEKKKNLK
jgi:hypothetical protein